MRWLLPLLFGLLLFATLPASAPAQDRNVRVGPDAAAVTAPAASTGGAVAPAPLDADLTAAQARCGDLKGGRFLDTPGASTWVTDARFHAATPERRASCEVTAYVNPQVFVGVLMPASATGWNGRYVFRGCGGSCGSLWTDGACGKHVRDGWACVFTNMGHFSDQIDNHWAKDSLEMQIDFGYRATHVAHVAGRAIVAAFEGRKPDHLYYYGCSTGGRQGMVEAERFPDDFDGLVVVAPVDVANYGRAPNLPLSLNLRDGKAILGDLDVPLLYRAVMKACDLNDGVRDGLVQPADCRFDPQSLLCRPDQAHGCLTQAKIDVARAFYRRGAQFGSELNWIDTWTADARPALEFAESRGDPATAESFYNAGNPDLTALRDHGARLMLMHGTTDLVVPPGATDAYYETATRTMGGLAPTQAFFRYFKIVGMDHCTGGDGAWAVNYLPIIADWVEHGHAPEKIVARRPKPGVALDYFGIDVDRLSPDQIAFSRPTFPYPLRAYYSGRGDPNEAASFVPGARPNGARAKGGVEALASGTPDELATQIARIAASTEKAYVLAGLPDKNVSNRVGKQLRFAIYNSEVPAADISAALKHVLAANPSPIQRTALVILDREFSDR